MIRDLAGLDLTGNMARRLAKKKNSTWKKSEIVLFTCSLSCRRSLARLMGKSGGTTYVYKEWPCHYITTLSIKESPSLVLYGQIIISQNKLNCSEAKTT